MELITLPQWHGAEAGGLNGGWFLQHRRGKEFYEEVHGHRLSRTRDLSDLCHGT